jgi:hypothetical protein
MAAGTREGIAGESPVRRTRAELCDALFAPPFPGNEQNGSGFRIAEIAALSAGPPVFRMEGTVAAPLRLLAAMIRESDLGSLAGSLARWNVLESQACAPFHQRIFYVSKLPWPFKDRAFYIGNWVERPTVDSLGIVSMSLEPDAEIRSGVRKEIWGEVAFSGYFLVPLDDRRTWLRRVIGVELRLPMPRGMLRRMLIQVYRGNYRWLNQAARSELAGRFEERMAKDALYATLPEVLG